MALLLLQAWIDMILKLFNEVERNVKKLRTFVLSARHQISEFRNKNFSPLIISSKSSRKQILDIFEANFVKVNAKWYTWDVTF